MDCRWGNLYYLLAPISDSSRLKIWCRNRLPPSSIVWGYLPPHPTFFSVNSHYLQLAARSPELAYRTRTWGSECGLPPRKKLGTWGIFDFVEPKKM